MSAIRSLQASIYLYSLWRQDWIDNMLPGDWADKCLGLISPEDLRELQTMNYQSVQTKLPTGITSSLRHYAIQYYDIPGDVFDYALIEFVRIQLCPQ